MIFSDRTIKASQEAKLIQIDPFRPEAVQPASYDVRLWKRLRVFRHTQRTIIDVRDRLDDLTDEVAIPEDAPFILQPGEFVLGALHEHIEVADDIVARIEGKSSLGRLGLVVQTAGYVDPGWHGRLTLELSNLARLPITLYRGMEIAQVAFEELTTPAERPYGSPGLGSKYQGDTEATASRYYMAGSG